MWEQSSARELLGTGIVRSQYTSVAELVTVCERQGAGKRLSQRRIKATKVQVPLLVRSLGESVNARSCDAQCVFAHALR